MGRVQGVGQRFLLERQHRDLDERVVDAPADEGGERLCESEVLENGGAVERGLLRLHRGKGPYCLGEEPALWVELPPNERSCARRCSQFQKRSPSRHSSRLLHVWCCRTVRAGLSSFPDERQDREREPDGLALERIVER